MPTAPVKITLQTILRSREGWDNGLSITLVPKVFQQRFLIRWLENFGTLGEF